MGGYGLGPGGRRGRGRLGRRSCPPALAAASFSPAERQCCRNWDPARPVPRRPRAAQGEAGSGKPSHLIHSSFAARAQPEFSQRATDAAFTKMTVAPSLPIGADTADTTTSNRLRAASAASSANSHSRPKANRSRSGRDSVPGTARIARLRAATRPNGKPRLRAGGTRWRKTSSLPSWLVDGWAVGANSSGPRIGTRGPRSKTAPRRRAPPRPANHRLFRLGYAPVISRPGGAGWFRAGTAMPRRWCPFPNCESCVGPDSAATNRVRRARQERLPGVQSAVGAIPPSPDAGPPEPGREPRAGPRAWLGAPPALLRRRRRWSRVLSVPAARPPHAAPWRRCDHRGHHWDHRTRRSPRGPPRPLCPTARPPAGAAPEPQPWAAGLRHSSSGAQSTALIKFRKGLVPAPRALRRDGRLLGRAPRRDSGEYGEKEHCRQPKARVHGAPPLIAIKMFLTRG